MGGPKKLRSGAAFAAVAALHVALVICLIAGLQRPVSPRLEDFVTTLLLAPAAPPKAPQHRGSVDDKTAPITPVERLIQPPAEISLPNAPSTSIDWQSEAKRSASAVIDERHIRELGRNPAIHADRQKSGDGPAHAVGEQYRIGDEKIIWVNSHCYVVSSVPALGMPDVLVRAIPTRTVCVDDSKPPGELFKDLPAYRKYRPQ
jgi:hypothetical protein